MSEVDSTERFGPLAAQYARFRPDYPDSAISFVTSWCKLGNDSLLVDVGSGTGISTRAFAEQNIRTIGLEPNDAMRLQAEETPASPFATPPEYRKGTAENTELEDQCADVVACAQSFHWFDSSAALAEFYRILKPGGWVALLWNERDESDTFTRAYGDVIRLSGEAFDMEARRAAAASSLYESDLFPDCESFHFAHQQRLNLDQMLGRAFSASYAPKEDPLLAMWENGLRSVYRAHEEDDSVVLRYRTYVHLGRKPLA